MSLDLYLCLLRMFRQSRKFGPRHHWTFSFFDATGVGRRDQHLSHGYEWGRRERHGVHWRDSWHGTGAGTKGTIEVFCQYFAEPWVLCAGGRWRWERQEKVEPPGMDDQEPAALPGHGDCTKALVCWVVRGDPLCTWTRHQRDRLVAKRYTAPHTTVLARLPKPCAWQEVLSKTPCSWRQTCTARLAHQTERQ